MQPDDETAGGTANGGGGGDDGAMCAADASAPADRVSAALEASLVMAQRALVVRREALGTLLDEVAALRAENEVLASAIADPSFGALRQRLHELEAQLAEERSARQAAERELADTAEATYEMWDAFRDWMGSDRAGTSVPSRSGSPEPEGASAGWRTPPLPPGHTPTDQASPAPSWQAALARGARQGASISPLPVTGASSEAGPSAGVSPRDAVPADAAAMERRVKALATKLQGTKDMWRGRPDTGRLTPRSGADQGNLA